MKKLKKILLINWLYFSKELIEVGDINFLTGKNGAGKSTVIDALQIVLLGETNSRNFNQAANEKSQRTLEGYLRADMDDNSPYSRRGKDFSTYIVCEFQDEMEGSSFVTGVTFDCRSDGSYRDTFFIYTGTLPENCFIEQGEAMEISALRRFLKQNYARTEFYDTQKEYRRNMLAKWNVHNEQVLRMMKKAVSFRPIVDIQKFITENICDIPDKPNIELMQQNIRDYKRHELLAQRQQEKLDALQQISRLYQEMNQAIDRCQIQKFLVRWAEKEAAQTEIDQRELERTECKENLANVNEQREELERQIEQKETRRSELELACRQSNVFQEEERLLTFQRYAELSGSVTMRAFSSQCFHDTKYFERNVRELFLTIARKYNTQLAAACTEAKLGERDQLAFLGIYARPELYELSGDCAICLKKGELRLSVAEPYGLALPSTLVSEIVDIELKNICCITFIENKTNYDEYLLAEKQPQELVVYHGGFLSPRKKKLFEKLAAAAGETMQIRFWADIDLGGFCMFENLQTVFPQLEPMRMEGRFVEQYHKNGLKRPEQYLKKLKEERNAGRHTLFVDAIDKILQYGVTIEQETFLE